MSQNQTLGTKNSCGAPLLLQSQGSLVLDRGALEPTQFSKSCRTNFLHFLGLSLPTCPRQFPVLDTGKLSLLSVLLAIQAEGLSYTAMVPVLHGEVAVAAALLSTPWQAPFTVALSQGACEGTSTFHPLSAFSQLSLLLCCLLPVSTCGVSTASLVMLVVGCRSPLETEGDSQIHSETCGSWHNLRHLRQDWGAPCVPTCYTHFLEIGDQDLKVGSCKCHLWMGLFQQPCH